MFHYIEKIREKSPRAKTQIAFSISFLVAGLIFVVWISVIYPDFIAGQNQEANAANLEPSPLSSLGTTVSNGMSGLTGTISEAKSVMQNFASTSLSAAPTDSSATSAESSTSTSTPPANAINGL